MGEFESLYAIFNNLNEYKNDKEGTKNVPIKDINDYQNNTNKKDKYDNNSQIKQETKKKSKKIYPNELI